MNKHIIKIALEKSLEQLVDSRENSENNEEKIKQIEQEIASLEKKIVTNVDSKSKSNILGMLKTNLSANKRNELLRIYNTL
jgi:hypothetical protein